ncbi:MAG: DUF1616 domain-containing protein, partial [Anaerolineales bacterium]
STAGMPCFTTCEGWSMARRSPDLLAATLGAIMGVAAQVLVLPLGLRIVLGVPLLLFWPGFALTAALFPRWRLGWTERAIFSLGLSLMTGILGAVMLNWSPWGLTTLSWTVLGSGVTLAAVLTALGRRRTQILPGVARLPGIGGGQLALLALAAVMTIGAVGLSRVPVYAPDVQGYTLLWMTPESEAGTPRLRLSVRSAELTTQSYRLELTVSGVPVAEWADISLTPGETWETTTFVVGVPTTDSRVEARLYRTEDPSTVYRRVSWWGSE